jgi:KaiC/GvpD/RAD55 family RecA-like ATPase
MSELLQAALSYARMGWHVFPCEPPRQGDETSGKAPIGALVPNGKDDATTDERTIRLWWHAQPSANIGINTERSGLIVLDVDVKEYTDKRTGERKRKQGMENLAAIDAQLTKTRIARTGSDGLHIVYARGDREARQSLDIRDGLDILGKGYFIAAPSNHYTGGSYAWVNEAPIAPVPDVLYTLKRISKHEGTTPAVSSLASLPEKSSRVVAASLIANVFPSKGRHNTFLALAGALASSGWDEPAITEFTTMVAQLLSYETAEDKEKALRDRGAQAHDAVSAVQSGTRVMSWGTLGKMLGHEHIAHAMERLEVEPGDDYEFVSIEAPTSAIDLGILGTITPDDIAHESARLAAEAKGFILIGELAQREYPPVNSYSTGFPEFDRLLGGGYSTQQMIVLLGKPGAGKTAFVMATSLFVEPSLPVLYCSTELQHNEIIARLASPLVECPWRDIVRAKAIKPNGEKLSHAEVAAALASKRIAILDQDAIYKAGEKAVEMIAKTALAMREHYGVSPLVIVDYMQELARGEKESRYAANTAVAVAFRMISQRLDCAIVAVSSVSRAGYGATGSALRERDDPGVYMALAKESGDIDYAAATIAFVDVAEEHDGFGWRPGRIAVGKSRHGEVGFAGVRFHGATGRWEAFADGVKALSNEAQASSRAERKMEEDESRVLAKVRELHAYGEEKLLDKTSLKAAVGGNATSMGNAIERLIVKRALVRLRQSYADAAGRMCQREVIALGEAVAQAATPARNEAPVRIDEIFSFGPT